MTIPFSWPDALGLTLQRPQKNLSKLSNNSRTQQTWSTVADSAAITNLVEGTAPVKKPRASLIPNEGNHRLKVVLVHTGDGVSYSQCLRPGQNIIIGRTAMVELGVNHDPLLSRSHFELRCRESHCTIHDLNSTNGTFLNDKAIWEDVLANGDQIVAGKTTFIVRIDQEKN